MRSSETFFDQFLTDWYGSGDMRLLIQQCGFRERDSEFSSRFTDSEVPDAPHFETAWDNVYALIYALIERDRQLEPWSYTSNDGPNPLGVGVVPERSYLIFSSDEDAVLARMLVDD